jgi:hypothetical protein
MQIDDVGAFYRQVIESCRILPLKTGKMRQQATKMPLLAQPPPQQFKFSANLQRFSAI